MANATKYIDVLIDSLTKFPGIGRKGAERIAYFIVKSEKSLGKNLINALKEVDAAASAVAKDQHQVVRILKYIINGNL